MSEKMELEKLKEPFSFFDVEWRIQSSGVKDGKPWARCLAYITNRAIMDRLDGVCGIGNWKNDYKDAPSGGILCGISIRIGDEWVAKWDGAEQTSIEKVKGGLSGSMKRAGVQWGIGRYLYGLDAGFAKISADGTHSDKGKDGKYFYWTPPPLPDWALPEGERGKSPKQPPSKPKDKEPEKRATFEDIEAEIKGAKTSGDLKKIWTGHQPAMKYLSKEDRNTLEVAKEMRKSNIEGGE